MDEPSFFLLPPGIGYQRWQLGAFAVRVLKLVSVITVYGRMNYIHLESDTREELKQEKSPRCEIGEKKDFISLGPGTS